MLSQEDIRIFSTLYETKTGIKLQPEDAENKAQSLIQLIKLLLKEKNQDGQNEDD